MARNDRKGFPRAFFIIALAFALSSSYYSNGQDAAEPSTNSNIVESTSSRSKSAKPTSKSTRSSAEIFSEYQEKLENLAVKCDKRGMALEAKVTRSLVYRDKPYFFTVHLLPTETREKKLPDDATKDQQNWYSALERLRTQYANETYSVAERLGNQKRGFDVVACVLQTLYIDPDHKEARRFFGYEERDGKWRSQWEMRKLESGMIDDPQFGWLPVAHIENYRKGQRYYHNQWISAEEESKKLLSSASGWKVETEHFSILSRVSLERGVEIGRFLEAYYQAWRQLFYPFIANENQWVARLRTSNPIVAKRHRVILYRNRSEYLRELRKHDENAGKSIGGYYPDLRCIFVYEPDPDNVEDCFNLLPTLAHEATHQLFTECNATSASRNQVKFSDLATSGNFWVAEGVAISAETFHCDFKNCKAEIGGYENVYRIEDALDALFEDDDYIPMRKFAGLSRNEFQSYKDLSLLYSQAAGTAFFLMFYKDGKYSGAYVKYLYELYQGTDSPDSLERLTGKSFEELDEEYKTFMNEIYKKSRQEARER